MPFFSIDLYLSEHTVVQPDLLFITADKQEPISERGIEGAPDQLLIVQHLLQTDHFVQADVYFADDTLSSVVALCFHYPVAQLFT